MIDWAFICMYLCLTESVKQKRQDTMITFITIKIKIEETAVEIN